MINTQYLKIASGVAAAADICAVKCYH